MMKKRLRKKYHVGEFKQFGFTVLIMLKPEKQIPDELGLVYDPIIDIVEGEKLSMAGGGGKNYITIAVTDQGRKNTITDEKADMLLKKIKEIDFVSEAIRFPLMDAWNSSDAEYQREDLLIKNEMNRLGAKEMHQ